MNRIYQYEKKLGYLLSKPEEVSAKIILNHIDQLINNDAIKTPLL